MIARKRSASGSLELLRGTSYEFAMASLYCRMPCEACGAERRGFRERAKLGNRMIAFVEHDGLAFLHAVKVFGQLALDVLDRGFRWAQFSGCAARGAR